MNSFDSNGTPEKLTPRPFSSDADPSAPVDEFNPQRFRLGQDFAQALGTEKIFTKPALRKPTRHDWFRVHPGDDMRMDAAILELKTENIAYLVDPIVIPHLAGDVVVKRIVLAVTRHSIPFLWSIKLPDFRGQLDEWNASAHVACEMARTQWVRLAANQHAGAYDVHAAPRLAIEPVWPKQSFTEILKLVFQDRVIASMDHAVVRMLKGEL